MDQVVTLSPPLIGRAPVVERLGQRLLQRPPQQPPASFLSGETGAGKSRVTAAVADLAGALGFTVLTGRGTGLVGDALPFAALAGTLRSLIAAADPETLETVLAGNRDVLAMICPEIRDTASSYALATEPSSAGRVRLFEAVRTTFERIAAKTPVLLVLEDVQWLSPTGVELLAYVIHTLPPQVALLVTYATDRLPLPDPLRLLEADVRRSGLADCVELPLLSRAEVFELISELLHEPIEPAVVDEAYRLTDGNPFLVGEFVSRISGSTDRWASRLLDSAVPQITGLSVQARQIAEALAIGGVTSHHVLAAVTGFDDALLVSALREDVDAGLVQGTSDGRGYQFRHVLLGEAVAEQLLPGERMRWHSLFARTLSQQAEADTAPSAQLLTSLARHLDGAGEYAPLLSWSLRAASAWERLAAFPEALIHYRRAISLSANTDVADQLDGDRADLLARAATVADLAGHRREAVALVGEALEELGSGHDPRRATLLERTAWYQFLTGDVVGATSSCEAALGCVDVGEPTAARAQILATHSRLLAMSGDARQAARLAQQALAEARAAGADLQCGRAMLSLGIALWHAGDLPAAEVALRQARAEGERLADAETAGPAYVALSNLLLLWHLDIESALDLAVVGYERLKELRLHRQVAEFLLMHASHCSFELGRWKDCETYGQQSRAAGGRGARYATVVLALLSVYRGETVSSETVAAQWVETQRDAPALVRAQGMRVAELYLALARPADALETVFAALDAAVPTSETAFVGQLLVLGMRAVADLADDARAARDEVRLAWALRASARVAHRLRTASPAPLVESSGGGAAPLMAALWGAEQARAGGQATAARWDAVIDIAHSAGRRHLEGYALWRKAEVLVSDRSTRKAAGPVIGAATMLAEGIGATLLVTRLAEMARAARISTVLDLHSYADRGPTALLTGREIDVLQLLAEGLTNRAIAERLVIGMKTVDAHIMHILQKLAVHDRVAAVDHARLLGMLR